MWSCGVLLYIMIASAYPFGRPEDEPLAPAQKMQVMLQVWQKQIRAVLEPRPRPHTFLACEHINIGEPLRGCTLAAPAPIARLR